jgi:hypothetical protein
VVTIIAALLESLWKAIDLEIELKECAVYTYVPDDDSSPFPDCTLWSFQYMFHNKAMKKMVTFAGWAENLLHGNVTLNSDNAGVNDEEGEGEGEKSMDMLDEE